MKIKGLDHITITSRDPACSIAFYKDVLGMTLAFEWPHEITVLKSGETFLAVAWWNKGKSADAQSPIAIHHFAFKVDAETYKLAKSELPRRGVKIEEESDHGIHQSLYFRDPDQHLVELTCYDLPGAPENMPKFATSLP